MYRPLEVQPYYPWSLAWRDEAAMPATADLLHAARSLSIRNGWLELSPPGSTGSTAPWLPPTTRRSPKLGRHDWGAGPRIRMALSIAGRRAGRTRPRGRDTDRDALIRDGHGASTPSGRLVNRPCVITNSSAWVSLLT